MDISLKHLFKYPKWDKEKKSVDTGINNFTKAYTMLEDYYNKLRKDELIKFIREEPKIDYDIFFERVKEIKNTKNYGVL